MALNAQDRRDRPGSSSPANSRASTPSSHSSPSSSDFLPSDAPPYGAWSAFAKPGGPDLYEDDKKPSYESFMGLDISNNDFQHPEERGMLLEELMQDDAYENSPMGSLMYSSSAMPQQVIVPKFEPSLPSLPTYPSPPPSEHPVTVQLSPSEESIGSSSRARPQHVEHHSFESSAVQNLLVTTPNAPCPTTSVVSPPRGTLSNLPILIHNVPSTGAKSRVETQIKMTLDLAIPTEPALASYDRVGSWKWLRLPKGCSTRRRPRKEGKLESNPDDTLTLSVAVTCASDPSVPVSACTNCLAREAKRTERKKAARVRPQRRDSSDSEEDGVGTTLRNGHGNGVRANATSGAKKENGGIVVFNCPELNDFADGRVVLPVRVTCYCRHHREKLGFRIAFTMADSHGRVIGRGSTPPIMITDDHKSVVKNPPPPAPAPVEEEEQPKRKRRLVKDTAADAESESRAKRRAKEPTPPLPTPSNVNHSNALYLHHQQPLYYTQQEPSPVSASASVYGQGRVSQSPSTFTTAPSSPQVTTLPSPQSVFLHYPVSSNDDSFMHSQDELDALTASLSSTSSSDVQKANGPSNLFTASSLFNVAYPSPTPSASVPPPGPQIHRLIPASGPTHGGIEVTVLGSGFLPTHRCVFGDTVASSTQMWSENTLVCLLPPSACPGPVVVSFEGIPLAVGGGSAGEGRNLQLFNYLDNSDRALMELALQVVGLKMTGRIEEAKNVAMRIVGNNSPNGGAEPSQLSSGGMSPLSSLSSAQAQDAATVAHSVHSRAGSDSESIFALPQMMTSSTRDFQSVIIEFLCLLDVNVPTTSTVTTREAISHASSSGQTLLHLSAILGFHRLLKHLITRGIDVDARDANGYTALHFAALSGRLACARILIEGGADVEIVEARGRTPREIARWRDQIDVEILLEDVENRIRIESGGREFDGEEADESDLDGDVSAAADGDSQSQSEAEEDESFDYFDDVASPTATIRPSHHEDIDIDDISLSPPSSSASESESEEEDDEVPDLPPQQENEKGLAISPVKPLSSPDVVPPPEKTSPSSLFHRTLSHLQPPPLPNLPTMPGIAMPQWGILPNQLQFPQLQFPQIPLHLPELPMVFHVQMPTPSWPAAFPWYNNANGAAGAGAGGEDKRGAQPAQGQGQGTFFGGGYDLASSPWFYPARWSGAAVVDKDPPMYTPPASGSSLAASAAVASEVAKPLAEVEPKEPTTVVAPAAIPEVVASNTANPIPSTMVATPKTHAIKSRLARRLGYEPMHVSERDIHAFEYHSEKMQKLKKDRMLVLFWLPILLIVLAYGLYQGVPMAIIAIQDLSKKLLPIQRHILA